MEIRLKREELLGELMPMQGVVERRTTIPVLSHLLLSTEGDRLNLAATDLDVSLTSSVAAEIKTPGALAIQARKFVEIIRSLVGDEITLALDGERSLKIQTGKSRFRIHGLPAADFPSLPKVDTGAELKLPLARFRRLVSKVLFAVSSEESRFQLSGALLKRSAGKVELVATDGHRLALIEAQVDGAKGEDSVLVPRKALSEILRFEGHQSEGAEGAEGQEKQSTELVFRRGEHHLAFRSGRRELVCRVLEGTFPDYERVISRNNDRKAVCDRKALQESVQRAALMTGDRNRGVKLEFSAGELTIAAANPDLGDATETLSCDFAGASLKIGLNPDYLVQFLAAVETDKVELDLKDENSQCVGRPGSGGAGADNSSERYLCVIMPMRI